MSRLLEGKVGIIMGVANDMSIAWAIAKKAAEQGATLIFTYQGEMLKKRVEPLASSIGSSLLIECDVTSEEQVEAAFASIASHHPKVDFLVHSIAFSHKNELQGRYADTTRANFLKTMDVSVFSFVDVTKHASKLMTQGGSILTLSYYGAEKVIPNYNVMGVAKAALECSVRYLAHDLGENNIRVNAISAGPIKTLAASGISGLRDFLRISQENSPLKRLVTTEDVANSALYLLSDMSSAVTGEVTYVDCGYNIMGMSFNASNGAA